MGKRLTSLLASTALTVCPANVIAPPANAQSPVTVIGPITVGNCAQFSSNTIIKDAGVVCSGGGGGGGIVIGTTTVTGAGAGQFLFNNAGVVGAATLGTMSTQNANAVAVTGGTITGLPMPVISADAATKGYVDAVAVGLTIHTQVAWATTAVLPNTPTYNNGSSGVGATLTAGSNAAIAVDGGNPLINDRVLVKNQAAGAQNGVYTVTTVGSGSVPWVLTRATDFNTATAGNMATGAYFFVAEGTINTASSWVFTTLGTITIGTTALSFSQFSNGSSGAVSSVNIGDAGSLTISPTTGAVLASINPAFSNSFTVPQKITASGSVLFLNTPSTAQSAQTIFQSAGTTKWQTGLNSDNSYFLYDSTVPRFDMTVASSGNMTLMPGGGNIVTGGPTGGGNLYVGGGSPWTDIKSGTNGCAAAAGTGPVGGIDDTAAIQCQITFMNTNYGGGFVFVPPGNYLISSKITVPGSVILMCAGENVSFLNGQAGNFTVLEFTGNYSGMRDCLVGGNATTGATASTVIVDIGTVNGTIMNSSIQGGVFALQIGGTDWMIFDTFMSGSGTSGGAAISASANWYVRDKFDTNGFTQAWGFLQTTNINSNIQENHFTDCDFSGTPAHPYTNSVGVFDGGFNNTVSVFTGSVFSAPIVLQNQRVAIFTADEIGGNITIGAGNAIITGSYGFGSITSTNPNSICSTNINITC
jgi:hypothetical protein